MSLSHLGFSILTSSTELFTGHLLLSEMERKFIRKKNNIIPLKKFQHFQNSKLIYIYGQRKLLQFADHCYWKNHFYVCLLFHTCASFHRRLCEYHPHSFLLRISVTSIFTVTFYQNIFLIRCFSQIYETRKQKLDPIAYWLFFAPLKHKQEHDF